MTSDEMHQFVADLTLSVTNQLVADIQAGKLPANWNGIELRWLIAERFAAEQHGKPTKDYKNEVLTRNL